MGIVPKSLGRCPQTAGHHLQSAAPCSRAAQHCRAEPAESSRRCFTRPSSYKAAPSPPVRRGLSHPDPPETEAHSWESILAPGAAVLTVTSLHQAYLWDPYQRMQHQLLKRQPLADPPMVPTVLAGHRPLSRAQSSPATATISLPAQDTASKTLSLPVQEQPTKPHFTTGRARGRRMNQLEQRQGLGTGFGDALGNPCVHPNHSRTPKFLGAPWLAAERAEQAVPSPYLRYLSKQDLSSWSVTRARLSSPRHPRQQTSWGRGSQGSRSYSQTK